MTVAQNYQLLNNALAQVLGSGAITVVDATTLADAGKKLASFQNGYELFNKAILDVMVRTEIDMELFDITGIPFLSKTERFGGFIREIYVGNPVAEENTSWNIGNDNYSPSLPTVKKLPVTVKCYTNRGTHRFTWTIPDMQLDSAFHSNEELDAYISGIGVAVENAVRIDIVEIARLVRAKFISDTFKTAVDNGNASGTVVYVYDLYKIAFPSTTLTAETCWNDKEFLRWSAELMSRYPKRLATVGSKYINEKTTQGDEYIRQTSKNHLVFEIISDIANKFKFFLDSDVYHNELVSLPKYNEVDFWQGRGGYDDTKDHTTISLFDDERYFNHNDILAVMYDDRAIMQIYDLPYSYAFRNQWDRYTTNGVDANYGYSYKKSYPCVIFATTANDTGYRYASVDAQAQDGTQYGVSVSSLQYSDVEADEGDEVMTITGRLKKMTATNNITNVWGKGYFLCLDFSQRASEWASLGITSVKVGLCPSKSSGLVELVGEDDKTGVFKIAEVDGEYGDKTFVVEVTQNGYVSRKVYALKVTCV